MRIKYTYTKLLKRWDDFKQHPLIKDTVWKAFFRYVLFNSIQSLHPKPRQYDWIDGLKFYAQKGDAGIVANIYYKLFDYEDSMFLLHHLKPNELFIDVGANVGHFTLLAAGICQADVIAFEPIPSTFVKLTKNIDLNKLSQKITTYNIGIGEEESFLNFTQHKGVMNAVALEQESGCVTVEVKKLDTILADFAPTFLKVDVEGYEYFVLKGATEILKRESLKYIIIELNSSNLKFGHTNQQIFELLLYFNFVPIRYDVENRKCIETESFNTLTFNTIFIKKSK